MTDRLSYKKRKLLKQCVDCGQKVEKYIRCEKCLQKRRKENRKWKRKNPNYAKEWNKKNPNYMKEWYEKHTGKSLPQKIAELASELHQLYDQYKKLPNKIIRKENKLNSLLKLKNRRGLK